mmetsp:Transcript_43145/g.101366  ORF Transcript_43145/g.101366 Transcript_43145/m.101366 type:complete len:261 (-) Transcript_43145:1463-2245(-)
MVFDLAGHDRITQALLLLHCLLGNCLLRNGAEWHTDDLAGALLRWLVASALLASHDPARDGDELLALVDDFSTLVSALLIIVRLHCNELLHLRVHPLLILHHELPLVTIFLLQWGVAGPGIDFNLEGRPLRIFHHLLELSHDGAFLCILALAELIAHLQSRAVLEVDGNLVLQSLVVIIPREGSCILPLASSKEGPVVQVVNGIACVHDGLPTTLEAETQGPEGLQERIAGQTNQWNETATHPLAMGFNVVVCRWEIEDE